MDRSRPRRSVAPARQRITAQHRAILQRLAAGELIEASATRLSKSAWWHVPGGSLSEREQISTNVYETIRDRGWLALERLTWPTSLYRISTTGREVLAARNTSVTPDSP